jgi:hypothetical protein
MKLHFSNDSFMELHILKIVYTPFFYLDETILLSLFIN